MTPMFGFQMCQSLESRGWVLVRVSGVHYVYRHPTTARHAIVPVRRGRELKPGTQRNLAHETAPAADEL